MLNNHDELRRSLLTLCLNSAQNSQETVQRDDEFKPTLEDLSSLEFVCRGPGGCIHRTIHRASGKRLIVKSIKLNRRLEARINREVDISLRLRHPQLIETFNVVYKEDVRFVYLIQNYYDGGDLLEFVLDRGPMRVAYPDLARWVLISVCCALDYMEREGMFHGDVKPENLLFETKVHDRGEATHSGLPLSPQMHGVALPPHPCCRNPDADRPFGSDERLPVDPASPRTLRRTFASPRPGSAHACFPNVRLIDFGHAQFLDSSMRVPGPFGTAEYSAPEAFARVNSAPVDGRAADVFSLGVTLFALLFGSLPWSEPSASNADYAAFIRRYEHMHGDRPLCTAAEWPSARRTGAIFADACAERLGVTPQLGELLDRMLCPDPERRITVHELLRSPLVYAMPWFTSQVAVEEREPLAVLDPTPAVAVLSPHASVSVMG